MQEENQQTETASFWPEDPRPEPIQDPFPFHVLSLILGVAMIALIIVLIPMLLANRASTRKVVYLDNEQTWTITQANLENTQSVGLSAPSDGSMPELSHAELLPVSKWSADGDSLASTVFVSNSIKVAVISPETQAATNLPIPDGHEWSVVPGNPWSPTGDEVAILSGKENQLFLSIYSVETETFLLEGAPIDQRTGFSWKPQGWNPFIRSQLYFTSAPSESESPSVQLFISGEKPRKWEVNADHAYSIDPAVSPNGRQVAYLAGNEYNDESLSGQGDVWLAQSDGTNNRRLVDSGIAYAPFWGPRSQYVYFFQYTEYGNFSLFRVDTSLANVEIEYVGPASSSPITHPFNRNQFAVWSAASTWPSRDFHLTFASDVNARPEVYVANSPSPQRWEEVQNDIPIDINGQWSSDRSKFAASIDYEGTIIPYVYDAIEGVDRVYTQTVGHDLAIPADTWSSSDELLVVVGKKEISSTLSVLDPSANTLATAGFNFLPQGGFDWNPEVPLIVASSTMSNATQTLQFFDPIENNSIEFKPEDGQLQRTGPIWYSSFAIIYLAKNDSIKKDGLDHLGSVWIADLRGEAEVLLPDERYTALTLNTAANKLVFAAYDFDSEIYTFIELDLNTGEQVELKESLTNLISYPLERKTQLNRALQSNRQLTTSGQVNYWYSAHSDLALERLSGACQQTNHKFITWSPSKRFVLVPCESNEMIKIQFPDQEKASGFSPGSYPEWQPYW